MRSKLLWSMVDLRPPAYEFMLEVVHRRVVGTPIRNGVGVVEEDNGLALCSDTIPAKRKRIGKLLDAGKADPREGFGPLSDRAKENIPGHVRAFSFVATTMLIFVGVVFVLFLRFVLSGRSKCLGHLRVHGRLSEDFGALPNDSELEAIVNGSLLFRDQRQHVLVLPMGPTPRHGRGRDGASGSRWEWADY